MRPFLAILVAAPALAQAPVPPLDTLTAPSGSVGDRLGNALALDADRLCAGIPLRDGALSDEGQVLTWSRQGAPAGVPTELESPLPRSTGQFGVALALEGTELHVGELRTDLFGLPARGAVHCYAEQGSAWVLAQSIESPTTAQTDFGTAIARDGDLLAVGAPRTTDQFTNDGAVHLYRESGGNWLLEDTLTASDPGIFARFGSEVALDGDRLVVGAPERRNGGIVEGAAYVFERIGGSWTETARLAIAGGSGDQGFGRAVAIEGATAVVGAGRTNQRGAVYVFENGGSSWTQADRLQPASLRVDAMFGDEVALAGDELLIGCPQDSVLTNRSGSAWLYARSGGSWTPALRLIGDPVNGRLGDSIALDGQGTYALGEPELAANGVATSGAVRVFEPDRPIGSTYCAPVANSTGLPGGIAALGSDLVADDRVELVAFHLPDNAFGFFLASRTQGLANQPGGSQGVLCLGGAIGRYVGPGQILNSGVGRFFSLELDLAQTPTPTGLVAVAPGDTWHFQTWHRDQVSGQATSNFTGATTVLFQ